MAKKHLIFIAVAIMAAAGIIYFWSGGQLMQFAQPGETVPLECSTKAECRSVLEADGATPEQAEEFVEQYVTCSGGQCSYRIQEDRGG